MTPVALAVRKRGRLCVVAKLTHFTNDPQCEPILAVAWRGQHGTKRMISMPQVVIDYARRCGVRSFYLRDDRAMTMRCCSLDTLSRGALQRDGERYVMIEHLPALPWAPWVYARETVDLTPQPKAEQVQLTLFARAA